MPPYRTRQWSSLTSKPFRFLPSLLLALMVLGAMGQAAVLRVLFIGNSHTYVHNVPQIVADIAQTAGERPLEFEMVVEGDYSLEQHYSEGKALEKIRSSTWDYVVLQEQSQPRPALVESYLNHLRRFDEAIRTAGAKTVLYLVWYVRESAPNEPWEVAWLKRSMEVAKTHQMLIAPVSQAWLAARFRRQNLYQLDGNHSNALGAYLSACVFYAVLYGKSPVGLEVPSIPSSFPGVSSRTQLEPQAARLMQELAWNTVQRLR